jgi:hypothetical protein
MLPASAFAFFITKFRLKFRPDVVMRPCARAIRVA